MAKSLMAHNTMLSTEMGFSPAQLVFGSNAKEMGLVNDSSSSLTIARERNTAWPGSHLMRMLDTQVARLAFVKAEAEVRLKKALSLGVSSTTERTYLPGQQVEFFDEDVSKSKKGWYGPGSVIAHRTDTKQVMIEYGGRIYTRHVTRVKAFRDGTEEADNNRSARQGEGEKMGNQNSTESQGEPGSTTVPGASKTFAQLELMRRAAETKKAYLNRGKATSPETVLTAIKETYDPEEELGYDDQEILLQEAPGNWRRGERTQETKDKWVNVQELLRLERKGISGWAPEVFLTSTEKKGRREIQPDEMEIYSQQIRAAKEKEIEDVKPDGSYHLTQQERRG